MHSLSVYFCVCVSLLRGKYRDHIEPLRVNIPSQVFLISLERGGTKRKRRKINMNDRKEKKEAGERKRKDVPRQCE